MDERESKASVVINALSVYFNPNHCKVITRDQSRHNCSIGTGIFVDINGKVILLTAAHVLKNSSLNEIEIYFWSQRRYVPIRVEEFKKDDDETIDIAYVVLNSKDISPYLSSDPYQYPNTVLKKPLTADIFENELAKRNQAFLYGYPAAWDEYKLLSTETGEGYSLIEPITLCTAPISDLCTQTHFYLEYPKELEGSFWTNGSPAELPDPEGISGGGIWQYIHTATSSDPANLKLVGIITHFDNLEKRIRATSILYIKEMLGI